MKPIKAAKSGAGDLWSTQNKELEALADNRDLPDDIGAYSGGKKGELIPGQKIPAKPESQKNKEEEKTGNPGDFTRWSIGLKQKSAKHMDENSADKDVCWPAMDGTNQPTKPHLAHDGDNTFMGFIDRRNIIKEKQKTCNNLNNE